MVTKRRLLTLICAALLAMISVTPASAAGILEGINHGAVVRQAAQSGGVAFNHNGVLNHGAFVNPVAHPPSPCNETVCGTST